MKVYCLVQVVSITYVLACTVLCVVTMHLVVAVICIFTENCQGDASDPTVSETISVGNVCIFKLSMSEWKIGRVLSFAYYLEKYKSSQVYTNTTFHFADQSKKAVGVLCTWYMFRCMNRVLRSLF